MLDRKTGLKWPLRGRKIPEYFLIPDRLVGCLGPRALKNINKSSRLINLLIRWRSYPIFENQANLGMYLRLLSTPRAVDFKRCRPDLFLGFLNRWIPCRGVLRTPQTPLNWKFMQGWSFRFFFEAKNRKIEISKIVDTSRPNNWIAQNCSPLIYFNPGLPGYILINPLGPGGLKK